ncbi:sigma-70 family RNA polymerase sigma factor [Streptomyces sp. NPDC052225]|uniref:sigma-70 family RNA polymerase sigma factor n=1 Tax=Streptomyces sp. NPDC052225 TaxID=3154949 RepID=UPI003442A5E9
MTDKPVDGTEPLGVLGEDELARRFEEQRSRLRSVAYRILGSLSEADDAVQEAWIRAARADTSEVTNLAGWLTTVVARVCLNMLRSRTTRREDPLDERPADPELGPDEQGHPEEEALLADEVGVALLVVLDTLSPAERVAFVLHDTFAVPFEQIAPLLDRTPASVRQLASRARRRIKGARPAPDADQSRRRGVVEAFLAATRGGDFQSLLSLLAPDVVLIADAAVIPTPQPVRLAGARVVAESAMAAVARARHTGMALIDGVPGLVMARAGHLVLVLTFAFDAEGAITGIEVIAERGELEKLEIVAA